MSYFYFNGFYSYEMGLIVEEKSIYNGPQPDFELISVPGRDGDIILDHTRYKNGFITDFCGIVQTKGVSFRAPTGAWESQSEAGNGIYGRSPRRLSAPRDDRGRRVRGIPQKSVNSAKMSRSAIPLLSSGQKKKPPPFGSGCVRVRCTVICRIPTGRSISVTPSLFKS